MNRSVIILDSYTAARKAAGILAGHGIRAQVIKVSRSASGCTFGISFYGDTGYVCGILRKSGMNCKPYIGSRPV